SFSTDLISYSYNYFHFIFFTHCKCLVFCILFFYPHGQHRYLHSFPTRRSSDLEIVLPLYLTSSIIFTGAESTFVVKINTPSLPRSEEHTSELQSRENLVCRLLLEKKKVFTYGQYLHH